MRLRERCEAFLGRKLSPFAVASLAVLWFLPSLLFSWLQLNDVFFWFPLSTVAHGLHSGQMMVSTQDQPAYEPILYALSSVSGLSPLTLSYLPIGAIFIPFCYYAVTRRLFDSDMLAALLASYVAFDYAIAQMEWSTFMYVWTHALFLGFLLSYWLYLRRAGARYLVLVLLFFGTTYLLHPTYTFWMILIVVAASAVSVFLRRPDGTRARILTTQNLAIGMVVFYFSFNQLFYKVFVKKLVVFQGDDLADLFIPTIRQFLGLEAVLQEKYSVAPAPPTAFVGYAAFIRTAIILGAAALLILLWVRREKVHIWKQLSDPTALMVIVLLGVGFAHTAAYAVYGHMSFRYIILVYPIAIVLLMLRMGYSRPLVAGFLACLIVVGGAALVSFAFAKPTNVLSSDTVGTSEYLLQHPELRSKVMLSDFETAQIVEYQLSAQGDDVGRKLYDGALYGTVLTGKSDGPPGFDLLVLNIKAANSQVSSAGWRNYEPLAPHLPQIATNFALDRVFDDGQTVDMTFYRGR